MIDPRPVTAELLDEFERWTHTTAMFSSSPQGAAFADELREVIGLARKVAALEHDIAVLEDSCDAIEAERDAALARLESMSKSSKG